LDNVVGLSTAHIVTERVASTRAIGEQLIYEQAGGAVREAKRRRYPAYVQFYDGGSKIEVKRERYKIPQVGGGKRGRVRTFSHNSRRRLMRKVAELRRDEKPLFITLTYPSEYPTESKVYKEHLRRFGIYLQRRYPRAAFIWRLEFQKRGAPHYHLLAYNIKASGKKMITLRAWIAQEWYHIVGSGDEKHLRAGTSVERLKSWRRVVGYVSKAVAKVSPSPEIASGELSKVEQATGEYVGRWWGVFGSKFMPFADKVLAVIKDAQAVQLIRYMRRYANLKYTRAYKSLTIFCDASGWLKHLQKLCYPEADVPHKAGESRSPVFA
jgi:hypothetical protein